MRIIRNVIAVIVGYAIFAGGAILLFKLANIDPHSDPSTGTALVVIISGIVFSAIGGFTAQLISGSGTLMFNYILAILMAAFACFSMFKSEGSHYTQLAAICLFAPASIIGGWLRAKMKPQKIE